MMTTNLSPKTAIPKNTPMKLKSTDSKMMIGADTELN